MFDRKPISINSQKTNIVVKTALICPGVRIFIEYKAIVHIMNGIDIFTIIKPVIINGLNDVINGFTHIGSKELRLAKFPVPKKPSSAKASCKQNNFALVYC